MLVCHVLFNVVGVGIRDVSRMAPLVGTVRDNMGSKLIVVYVTLKITVPGVFKHHFVTSSGGGHLTRLLGRHGTHNGFIR